MPIKSYRRLMTDGDQIKIPLHHTGKGYRIVKFQVMPNDIDGSASHECSIQVWKQKQTSLVVDIDFNQDALLGAAYYVRSSDPSSPYVATISEQTVVFDREVINQDIFVVYKTGQSGQKLNFYLELEEVSMNDSEAAVVNYSAAILHS